MILRGKKDESGLCREFSIVWPVTDSAMGLELFEF